MMNRWMYPILCGSMVLVNVVLGVTQGLTWFTVAGVAITSVITGMSLQMSRTMRP